MCGIIATLKLNGQAQQPRIDTDNTITLKTQIDQCLQIIKHRGPDAEGIWISPEGTAGLGHVRLSIIDLSPAGNQPFHDDIADIHAVVNGELYGHETYREKLKNEFTFKGQSDCEIVIALYKHYGISFLSHLRGEFALVLYDARRKVFFAAKDRYGIKSLYYTVQNGQLLVATEMKQFLAFGWKPQWNVRALKDNGWRYDQRTIFKHVFKVLPGQYLISKDSEPFRLQPYWDLEYPDKQVRDLRTEEEIIQTIQAKLIDAVRVRLRADVPVGIYLSGGLDSSAVAGIVSHLIKAEGTKIGNDTSGSTHHLTCLSVGFDKESGVDESDIAQRTATWLGADFIHVNMNEEEIARRFEDTAWYSETVAADANGPGKLAMAQAAHEKGLKVVLTGEGSDEHFGGYSSFRADAIREHDHAWPNLEITDDKRQYLLESAKNNSFTKWKKDADEPPESTKRMLHSTAMHSHLSQIYSLHFAPWTDTSNDIDQGTVIAEMIDGRVRDNMRNRWHPLHTSEYIWTKTQFPNVLLRYIGDNVDMVHHIESRTPFLDHNLTEYANNLPPSLKMRYNCDKEDWEEKWILKAAAKPFITEEVYNRRKQPFLGPMMFKENGPLHLMCKKIIIKENVDLLGFLNWEFLQTVVENGWIHKDPLAIKEAFLVVQLITLSKRFGVEVADGKP